MVLLRGIILKQSQIAGCVTSLSLCVLHNYTCRWVYTCTPKWACTYESPRYTNMKMKISNSVQNWTPVWIIPSGRQTCSSAFLRLTFALGCSLMKRRLIWISCLPDDFSPGHSHYLLHVVQQNVVEIGASVQQICFESMFQLSLKITTDFYKKPWFVPFKLLLVERG